MARFCACLAATPERAAGHLAAMGAAVGAGAPGAALIQDEPGHATGPFTAYGRTAVGEVTLHNRSALFAALERADAPAPPGCPDGELLLRCWVRLGAAGIRAAEGMFALAVHDAGELVLIRDHMGARTLFYARADDCWAASTSLRALRRWPALGTGLELAAVRSFLTFAYLPGEETLLRGVREVLPGRCLRLAADGAVTEEHYWEPQELIEDDGAPPESYALRLRELLEEATACRLPEAEAVGVLLSGGVDSSLVTALAAKLHAHPVHTYSISFGDELPNELGYSGLVAQHCHTRHRVLTVSGDAVAARLAEAAALLDSPVGDPLTVPNLMLAEAVAGDGLRVVLNGEGGDPVFGGPKNLPMLVYEMHRGEVAGGGAEDAREMAYLRSYRKCFTDLPELLTAEALDALATAPGPERFVAPYLRPAARDGRMDHLLNQLLHCNLRTKGAHHILTKVERLTASQGIQGRAPLFDRRVVDHAFATPPRWKLNGAVEKWVLKEAVRDLLPDTVVDRPKSGMRVPVQQWLGGPLRELAGDLLLGREARARGLFRPDTVRSWMRGEGTLLPRQGGKLWLVLTLELWLRAYDIS
ncbi:asparagine synthase C-terminal domain-containing protein [Streptomyces scopuliridis]|uniref:Asparagine synthase C-terminal domain-containing protein n=1 Tax=Streptomyces scopuliridis TaxID=452529 RepID=A0ACD4ZJ61_9ACTN|nr:asparagine synthase-related protein [Streptomyces scopuliridis]WSB33755.1 asparagine synthase C-terminal domain-containing protein [Streptomyces scopuliridis]WSB98028.1 asparagine synthase C-terminal domain-containing protein [Streptomyces scopuliridis]WSC08270.1 asparagine synthase C-terminal domain-containing protein [Streptomyces scopuliridis]